MRTLSLIDSLMNSTLRPISSYPPFSVYLKAFLRKKILATMRFPRKNLESLLSFDYNLVIMAWE